jgi:hypothetical protein
MASDYIPDSFENRLGWFKNLHDRIGDFSAQLGWTAQQVTDFKGFLAPHIAGLQAIVDAQTALDRAIGGERTRFADDEEQLRKEVNLIKGSRGFDDGIGEALKIFTTGGKPDPANIKPTLKAEAQRGQVRITGRKNYAETVNIYTRRKNETAWRLLVAKRTTFPFEDQTPLAQPGVPEEREYQAMGVNGDTEIGQPSDIVSAVFGG